MAVVAGPHGVRGAFKLRCFTAEPAGVAAYGPLLDEAGRTLFSLQVVGPAPGGVVAQARGITDRDAAAALRGTRLHVTRDRLPVLADADEFYHEDLVGLAVLGPDGQDLGKVIAVHDFGAGALLELVGPDGRTTVLPFTRAIVPRVDLAAGRITVHPPGEVVAAPEQAP